MQPLPNKISSRLEHRTVRSDCGRERDTGANIVKTLQGHSGAVDCIAFSPDGKNIAAGSDDGSVRLWSAETGYALAEMLAHLDRGVLCLEYSPNGKHLAIRLVDTRVFVWDIDLCKPVANIAYGSFTSSAFSPNGMSLALGSDKEVQFWNVATGEMSGEPYRGHAGIVRSICFSPDGCHIVSGSYDGSLKMWNAETREEVLPYLQVQREDWINSVVYPRDIVNYVSYSHDGSQILSVSPYGIAIWNSLTHEPLIATNRITAYDESTLKVLSLDDYQLFQDWLFDNGWLIDASGEFRLLLPGYMHKLVHQVDTGVYVHHCLHLNLCNAAAKDLKGFVLSS